MYTGTVLTRLKVLLKVVGTRHLQGHSLLYVRYKPKLQNGREVVMDAILLFSLKLVITFYGNTFLLCLQHHFDNTIEERSNGNRPMYNVPDRPTD